MDPDLCLYHKDKDDFNGIQQELQKCGWIPRKHVHRLAMAVCACRKRKAPLPSRDEFLDLQAELQTHLEPLREVLPNSLLSCIDHCLNTATETDYSYCQLITVLVKGKNGDYSPLSRAVLSTNSKISERDLQREINRKKKLTATQIEIIKSKKKKKMNSVMMKLPVFPGNFLKLELKYVKEMKGFIEPQYKLNNENFEKKTVETWVKVYGDASNMKSLSARLIEEARAVQERMDEEIKRRKERKVERRRMYDSYSYSDDSDSYEGTVMNGFVKDNLVDDFGLKVQKSSKDKTKTKLTKTQSSVLDSGHCLQCFKTFTDLHDNTPCTYHEGYAVSQTLSNKRIWSCCSVEVEELEAHVEHSKTGCTTSRVHNWRTHKKAKGKDWDKFQHKQN